MNNTQEATANTTETEQKLTPENKSKASREAAKYRTQLRETEAQLEAVKNQLLEAQKAHIESLPASHGITAKALWKLGVNPSDLLNEHGAVDPSKVTEAYKQAAEELGVRVPRPDPAQSAPDWSEPETTNIFNRNNQW